MRFACVLVLALFGAGCVTGPPQEAIVVREIGDKEVAKLRLLAEININKRFDSAAAQVWSIWRAAVDQAKALDTSGKGMVPAEFMEKSIELRDEKLLRIQNSRMTALSQAADLQENYVTASGAIYDAWAQQGKVTAEMIKSFREAAIQGAQMYSDYRAAKSLAKEAKQAADAAAANAGEGQ